MHGRFARDMEDMRKSDFKGCTKALICSAQEQSIQTNYIKYNIDKTAFLGCVVQEMRLYLI